MEFLQRQSPLFAQLQGAFELPGIFYGIHQPKICLKRSSVLSALYILPSFTSSRAASNPDFFGVDVTSTMDTPFINSITLIKRFITLAFSNCNINCFIVVFLFISHKDTPFYFPPKNLSRK